jgi:hypothetical protein
LATLFPQFRSNAGAGTFDKGNVFGHRADGMIPWSFAANVVFPIFKLRCIGRLKLALDVRRFDG